MRSVELRSGTGHVVVTEEGGRVIALHPGSSSPNLLWRGDTAPVAGGDRLWLSPEREVLYDGDPSIRENWRCPEEMDPGTWRAEMTGDQVVLVQHALGSGMRRTVRPLSMAPVDTNLAWAGFTVHDEVETDRRWSGWHLTMVAAPARFFVREAREPLALYGQPPPLEDGWVRAAGSVEWKLGLLPPMDGRVVMAAIGEEDPGPLVVLITHADPHGTYLDRPPHGGGHGTALQLYDSPNLGFCEMEHHFPLEDPAATTTVMGAVGTRVERLDLLQQIVDAAPAA